MGAGFGPPPSTEEEQVIFKSKATAFIQIVRTDDYEKINVDGLWLDRPKEYACDFSLAGAEFQATDLPMEMGGLAVDLRGGSFDTTTAQEMNNWTDAEREKIEAELIRRCSPGQPGYLQYWLWTKPRPPAPWKGYDEHHVQKIVSLATDLDMVDEAYAYEKATSNRPQVLASLLELHEARQAELTLVGE